MSDIDYKLRKGAVACRASENFGKNIQRKDVRDKTTFMINYLNDRYKEVLDTAEADLAKQPAETGGEIAHGEAEKAGVNINIGAIQAKHVQIANRASIRQELRTQDEATKRTTWDTIWQLVKKVPAWIYGLVIFLAGLLTILYYLGWL
jgi:hypothetical protein